MKLFCIGLLITVCRTVEAPPPARITVAVCPVTANWSAAFQKRLAHELHALPDGSAVERAVAEAVSLRDQTRACRARWPG